MTLRNELGRLRHWWSQVPTERKYNLGIAGAIGAAIVLVVGLSVWIFQAFIDTDPRTAVIVGRDWERQIEIEMFKTIQDRDWQGQEPDDARVYDARSEVHHRDPYECGGLTINMDGELVYKSETCYRDVYYTRLYYEVDRWRTHRWVVSQGRELQPAWPSLPETLNPVAALGNERKGDETKERYTIHVKCDGCGNGSKVNVALSEWDDFTIAREVTALVTARGTVKDIKVPAQGT